MDPETARLVVISIAAVGLVVWLSSLQFLLTTFRTDRQRRRQAAEVLEMTEAPPDCIFGSVDVDGLPAELAVKAAGLLAKGSPPLPPVKILERTDQRIVFEDIGAGMNQQGGYLRQGQLRFSPVGSGRTHIDYAIELKKSNVLVWLAILFQTLGLAALVGGFVMIYIFAVEHPNPDVRTQAIQMVQAVHFLWPPFLFAGIYRRGRTLVTKGFELFINNLPYHGKE
jgi:hypothetical protein